MPTLHWIGKEKVINHHLDVPFRVLEHQYTFNGEVASTSSATDSAPVTEPVEVPGVSNKIIHGDNLEALKALLPEYEGKIKCIYIDPPYNTGNEGWVYNDNVNDPKIKKWLGQVVGKEAEDLTRHDKWLCMMYPRLKLLHKLLAEDGAIFISIDDNEQANLKLVCDEIWGGNNFVAMLSVIVKTEGRRYGFFAKTHENLFVYCKKIEAASMNEIEVEGKKFTYLDEKGGFNLQELRNQNARVFNSTNRPNLRYPFYVDLSSEDKDGFCKVTVDRINGFEEVYPIETNGYLSVWRWGKEEKTRKNLTELIARRGSDGIIRVYQKYRKITEAPKTVWFGKEFISIKGTKEVQEIFDKSVFDFPKPLKFIENIIQIATDTNSIILDSFAGSGTTAHAVLNLNKQDGGNRKFICIEMEDYAETITAERVKRVIKGYGDKVGTGGSFDYYELGPALFNDDNEINELVGVEKLRQYIYYTETKCTLSPSGEPVLSLSKEGVRRTGDVKDNEYLLNKHNNTAYYFYYEQDMVTTLNHEFLSTIKTRAEQYVIYADNCLLTKEFMMKHHIIFKKIPRDITKF